MLPASTTSIRTALTVLAAAALMSACSAKVSSDAPGLPAAPNVPAKPVATDQVAAINLDGVWASECEGEPHGLGTVKVTMTIKDHDFARTSTYYSDWDCRTYNSTDTISGSFTFQKSKADSVYEVEYLVKGDSPYRMPGNIKRVDGTLWIGLLANADYAPTIELKLVK